MCEALDKYIFWIFATYIDIKVKSSVGAFSSPPGRR